MKQKDIVLIIVIVFVAGFISFFVSKLIFSAPANREQKVEVVDAITTDFTQPDARYFNKNSVDPTQLIEIGNSNNPSPFNKGQ